MCQRLTGAGGVGKGEERLQTSLMSVERGNK